MGMTLAEKILARASGCEVVSPDQVVVADVDLAMSHENADLVRKSFREIGVQRLSVNDAGKRLKGDFYEQVSDSIPAGFVGGHRSRRLHGSGCAARSGHHVLWCRNGEALLLESV